MQSCLEGKCPTPIPRKPEATGFPAPSPDFWQTSPSLALRRKQLIQLPGLRSLAVAKVEPQVELVEARESPTRVFTKALDQPCFSWEVPSLLSDTQAL